MIIPCLITKPCSCKQSIHKVDVQPVSCSCSEVVLDKSGQQLYALGSLFGDDNLSTVQSVASSTEQPSTESKVVPRIRYSVDDSEAVIQPGCKANRKFCHRRSRTSCDFTSSVVTEVGIKNLMDEILAIHVLNDMSVTSTIPVIDSERSEHSSLASISLDESHSESWSLLGSLDVEVTTDEDSESDFEDDYECSFAFDNHGWNKNTQQWNWVIAREYLSSQCADIKIVETQMLDHFANLELIRSINEDYTAIQCADSHLVEQQMRSYFSTLSACRSYDLVSFTANNLVRYDGRSLSCILEIDEAQHEILCMFDPLFINEPTYQLIGRFKVCYVLDDVAKLFVGQRFGHFDFRETYDGDDVPFTYQTSDINGQDTFLPLDVYRSQLTREQVEMKQDVC